MSNFDIMAQSKKNTFLKTANKQLKIILMQIVLQQKLILANKTIESITFNELINPENANFWEHEIKVLGEDKPLSLYYKKVLKYHPEQLQSYIFRFLYEDSIISNIPNEINRKDFGALVWAYLEVMYPNYERIFILTKDEEEIYAYVIYENDEHGYFRYIELKEINSIKRRREHLLNVLPIPKPLRIILSEMYPEKVLNYSKTTHSKPE